MNTERQYIAIDLKSFYASVECVERGLDRLNTCPGRGRPVADGKDHLSGRIACAEKLWNRRQATAVRGGAEGA